MTIGADASYRIFFTAASLTGWCACLTSSGPTLKLQSSRWGASSGHERVSTDACRATLVRPRKSKGHSSISLNTFFISQAAHFGGCYQKRRHSLNTARFSAALLQSCTKRVHRDLVSMACRDFKVLQDLHTVEDILQ